MKCLRTAALALVVSAFTLRAGIIFTIEAPGVQQTTVAGALTENFDTVTPGGIGTYNSGIGVYTGGSSNANDIFGGANGSQYFGVGVQSGTDEATITFNAPKTYFGFWWSAGDGANWVEFYDGGVTPVATFNIGAIIPFLNPAYFGNPDNGQNLNESYAYLNFTATDADRIRRVVFRQIPLSGGFETDNHSTFDDPLEPPGETPMPEPSSIALALIGAAALATRKWFSRSNG
jgi:hypothetical protein